jgi:endonuclease/exonuclease/phosphatase family metal-dependent hydrolase
MSLDLIETGSFEPPTPVSAQPEVLHVVSWNIARGIQRAAITNFLLAQNADIILLQESDCNARRTACRNIARELAESLRMHYTFGIEFQELGQNPQGSPAFHGQATLSRWPLSASRILRFRRQSRFWEPRWWIPPVPALQRRIGGRIALVNTLDFGDKAVVVYNLHLESRNSDDFRVAQLIELLDDIRQHVPTAQVVLAGDFNFDLGNDVQKSLLQSAAFENPFTDLGVSTIAGSSHRRAIDWILIRSGKGRCPRVHDSVRASDHYPLSLTVHLA